jgi:hypothetical protein
MKPDDAYERWKSSRAAANVSADFADRVMSSIEQVEAASQRRRGLQALVLALVASRIGRVTIWSLACAACAARVLGVLALFISSS